MKKIAIIPARGGSKRILRKNCKDFLGKPIIAYSIESAIKSRLFDEIIVSTDDMEIAEIARNYGAKVPFMRSAKNSDDFSTTVDVILEVLNWYAEIGEKYTIGTCIYACSPFVTSELLIQSDSLINNYKADCVFPVIEYSHPIQRALILDQSNKISPIESVNNESRTQDFVKSYHDAGMFYTFDVLSLFKNRSLRTENTYSIPLSQMNSQDIDTFEDWKIAEIKYKLLYEDL